MADTKFKKGKERGPGRPKGTPNKVQAQLKDMILHALDGAGGVEYLQARANDPRTASAFLALVGKVLPMTIKNADGEAFRTENVWRVEVYRPNADTNAT